MKCVKTFFLQNKPAYHGSSSPVPTQRRTLSIRFYKHVVVCNRVMKGSAAEESLVTSLEGSLRYSVINPDPVTRQVPPQKVHGRK